MVLINNSGGGIFSFLPIADALPEDVFTPLWATPQHVDLEGALGGSRVEGGGEAGGALVRQTWRVEIACPSKVDMGRAGSRGSSNHRAGQGGGSCSCLGGHGLNQGLQRKAEG